MNKFSYLFFNLIAGIILFSACAKQSSPTGGPIDENPPDLLESDPPMLSTNTSPEEINLIFNEYVQVENPHTQIIITPRLIFDEIGFLAIKNRINIKLNQPLEDSTTYVFNFQNSIQDITEGNPADRLKLVFSTGSTIDSLKVIGKVDYIFPGENKEFENILVGLYDVNDTIDVFTGAPYYISQTDSLGNFEITNIKEGTFKIYAWHDDNNSLKAEYRSEAYGFVQDTLFVNQNLEDIQMNLFRGDISELKINRSSTSASNFDIILSKPVVDYEIVHKDLNQELFHRLEDKSIRLYHRSLENDSTEVQLILKDSVGFIMDTVLMAKFEPSERNKEALSVNTNTGTKFTKQIKAILNFNKPIYNINYDSLYFSYDSVGIIAVNNKNIEFMDSTKRRNIAINLTIPDTVKNNSIKLFAADSTFQDVEDIWNEEKIEATYTRLKEENLADGLKGRINTEELPIILQLLDKNEKVLDEKYLTETNTYEFTQIEAGDYKLRAIIDRNENKRWDTGNILENRQPEPVYYFFSEETQSDLISLKGGWTLDEININPKRDAGLNKPDQIPNIEEILGIPKEVLDIKEEDLYEQ